MNSLFKNLLVLLTIFPCISKPMQSPSKRKAVGTLSTKANLKKIIELADNLKNCIAEEKTYITEKDQKKQYKIDILHRPTLHVLETIRGIAQQTPLDQNLLEHAINGLTPFDIMYLAGDATSFPIFEKDELENVEVSTTEYVTAMLDILKK